MSFQDTAIDSTEWQMLCTYSRKKIILKGEQKSSNISKSEGGRLITMSEESIPGSSCGKVMPEDKSAFSIMVFEQVRAHAKMS